MKFVKRFFSRGAEAGSSGSDGSDGSDDLETRSERRARLRSLYIVHVSMLVVSLGSSIIYTGVKPYLESLDRSHTAIEYGLVVAADATANMIFSPLFGLLTDRVKSVRPVALLCCCLFCGGNILYSLIGMFDREILFGVEVSRPRVWMMFLSRFIVGAGTAINSTGRYYVSLATRIEERTTHIALLSLFQTMGFIIGPGIQAGLVPLGAQRITGESSGIYLDMFTATGWVSASTGALCILLYLPYIFQEKYIAVKEREFIKIQEKHEKLAPVKRRILREASRVSLGPTKIDTKTAKPRQLLKSYSRISVVDGGLNFNRKLEDIDDDSENGEMGTTKAYPPIIPAFTCLYNYFSFFINFVLLETILTPLAMDMWAWSAAEALQNIGLTMIGGGFLSLLVFALIGPLSKRFDERILLLVMGILPMILGRVVLFPFPGAGYPLMRVVNSNISMETTVSPVEMSLNTADFSVSSLYAKSEQDFSVFSHYARSDLARSELATTGCKYEWCTYIPKITVAQFLVGYGLATMGYPFCVTLTASLYSKMLVGVNQGLWLGLLTTFGSLARVIGPLFVSSLYAEYGTYLIFGLITGSLVLAAILTLISFKKLKTV